MIDSDAATASKDLQNSPQEGDDNKGQHPKKEEAVEARTQACTFPPDVVSHAIIVQREQRRDRDENSNAESPSAAPCSSSMATVFGATTHHVNRNLESAVGDEGNVKSLKTNIAQDDCHDGDFETVHGEHSKESVAVGNCEGRGIRGISSVSTCEEEKVLVNADSTRTGNRTSPFGSESSKKVVTSSDLLVLHPSGKHQQRRTLETLQVPRMSWPGALTPSPCSTPTEHRGRSRSSRHERHGRSPNPSQDSARPGSTHSNSSHSYSGVFRKGHMIMKDLPCEARRQSSYIQARDLEEGASQSEPTTEAIESMLVAEQTKLKRKTRSRSYENDRRQVLLERALLKSRCPGKTSKKEKKEFASIAPEESYAVEDKTEKNRFNDERLRYLGWVTPLKWAVTAVVAVLIALQAGAIIMGTVYIVHWKMHIVEQLRDSGSTFPFLFLLSYGLVAGFIAAILVAYWAPHAGGSGIPEIKSYLNGIASPQAFTAITWFSRSVGLVLVTSAGLFAGTEGPFAHLGGIVASSFSEGPRWKGKTCWPTILNGHRNKCELMSQGCAMGVAAAFGAPVGGILFSLEEASSYWSKSLTWQTFLGTMIAAVTAKLVKSGFTNVNAAGFIEFPDRTASFQFWELSLFALFGVISGLLGALFCAIVKRTFIMRRKIFKLGSPTPASRRARVIEVMLVVTLTMVVCFWIPTAFGCTKLEHPVRRLSGEDTGLPDISGGICPEGSYSGMGHLLLQPKEAAIKVLFSRTMHAGAELTISNLLWCYVIIYCTTLVTFGTAIPVGLFIPNILAGACLGRAGAEILVGMGCDLRPDVYALVGAAGALAGFSRMTISLAMIFLEITNNVYMLLPLMLVIMTSKVVADRFNPSVYDIVLECNPDIHLLEDELSEDRRLVLEGLTAHDACSADVVVLREFEPLSQIVSLLMQTSFDGYPVVDPHNRLVGVVNRSELLSFVKKASEAIEQVSNDLVPVHTICETSPEVTLWSTPVTRAFHHFQAIGLKHLCVVSACHELLGILTRTDFSHLCAHGAEGIQHIDMLISRKQQACEEGNIEMAKRPEPWELRHGTRIPTGSTGDSSDSQGYESQDTSCSPSPRPTDLY